MYSFADESNPVGARLRSVIQRQLSYVQAIGIYDLWQAGSQDSFLRHPPAQERREEKSAAQVRWDRVWLLSGS